jgi:hypothetical protein
MRAFETDDGEQIEAIDALCTSSFGSDVAPHEFVVPAPVVCTAFVLLTGAVCWSR